VVIHPGAASPARRWPPRWWSTLIGDLLAAGRRVVVTSGPADQDTMRALRATVPSQPDLTLAETPGVERLAAVVAHAAMLVCGDTGPAHLATAFGTPSVLLFGPTDPARWGPRRGDRHRVLWAGRVGDPHGDEVDEGLLELDPVTVMTAVDQHLRRTEAVVPRPEEV
jgi:ADP-heptose:LPS heptosyltransferase